jgi:valyl-tRNA synthetase
MKELDKSYDPLAVEPRWAQNWATPGTFKADPKSYKQPFTIVIPPPNITGSLHLGHALDNTVIDILVRFKRMIGFEALYLPGTDHAGISTQVVVERQLREQGLTRHDLGREQFLERVWAWKTESGNIILNQLTRLGVSADWSRERFTMDDGLSQAVRRSFVEYYHQGLAYRGERIINWDPIAQTVLSDLEVERETRSGQLYVLDYRLENGESGIKIATQRPETIFADVAVAVHPEDERYSAMIGQQVRIPLTERLVPIIADAAVERDFGTGALKITPAHDPTDFEIGARHNLAKPSVIDKAAKLSSDLVPAAYRGLDRFVARKAVVKDLEAAGFLLEAIAHSVPLPISERTKEPIEPLLMTQWFVNMKPAAQKVLKGLDKGEMKLHPARYEKVNRDWLENIRDWAVGRQLWWGHQIPAWYDEAGNIYVPDPSNPALDCDQDPRYADLTLVRDTDVFDTWFSSALWPFSTLGWPNQDPDLAKFYPNSVLVTGYDILFFWVARMQMSGYQFTGQAPFKDIMLHGLYLDGKGQKMSKSKNNGIDPLVMMDKFGADACRFAWAYLQTGGQDIKHDERRYEQGRNFANKLWNASRFAFAMLDNGATEAKFSGPTLADRWIVTRLNVVIDQITAELEAYDLAAAIRTIYSFTWDEFCDWYIEAAKPALKAGNESTREMLKYTLSTILKLLHPFMPFITSELYEALNPYSEQLALEGWPEAEPGYGDPSALRDFGTLIEAVTMVRSLRAELGLSPAQAVQVTVSGTALAALQAQLETFQTLGRAQVVDSLAGKTLSAVTAGLEVRVPIEGLVDVSEWLQKLKKRMTELEKQQKTSSNKLANAGFVAAAPSEVIEEEQKRLADANAQLERLGRVVAELGQA